MLLLYSYCFSFLTHQPTHLHSPSIQSTNVTSLKPESRTNLTFVIVDPVNARPGLPLVDARAALRGEVRGERIRAGGRTSPLNLGTHPTPTPVNSSRSSAVLSPLNIELSSPLGQSSCCALLYNLATINCKDHPSTVENPSLVHYYFRDTLIQCN